jgi:hypothetical protein
MTIIGIGGLISYLQFGDKTLPLSERAWAVAGFGIRGVIACGVLLPLGLGWFWAIGWTAALFAGSWQGHLWSSEYPLAYIISHIVVAIPFLPMSIAVFVGILTMRTAPIAKLFRHTIRR